MMKNCFELIRYALVAVVLCCVSFSANATFIHEKNSFYTPHGSSPVAVTGAGNAKFVAVPTVSSPDVSLLNRGVITLGIDHHHTTFVAEHHVLLNLSIKRWNLNGTTNTITTSLEIDYKPNTLSEFNDAKLLEVDGVYKYEVTITSISLTTGGSTTSPTTLPANVFLDLDLFAEHIYDFGAETNSTVNLDDFDEGKLIDRDCDDKVDELLIEWDPMVGAEEYQLEWAFINDYTATSAPKDAHDLAFDFKLNSTRVLTSKTNYSISLIYPRGYIVYRIRAVGRLGADPTKRVYSKWSTQDRGTVQNSSSTLDANDYYYNTDEWEISKNWQYSVTFAEEGKKKEVVSFFDGTLRNRQMVTLTNSNDKAIVGETIYDHIGRPAVQVLPVPVATSTTCESPTQPKGSLMYYDKFNRNGTEAYSGLNIAGTSCATGVSPMSTTSGASQYYSSSNPDNSQKAGYIPDAGGYPFSQVEYTTDNTGRIKRQGGVGADFQLNGNHTSRYFYAHPSQLELDRMFGSEVGDATHYQKNMVVDPNGQVSISYLDQEGRVIATALAGDVAPNVSALPSQAGANATLNESLFDQNSTSNVLSPDGLTKTFNATFAVSAQTNMTFSYDLDATLYNDDCLASNVCFGCVYDLTIEVTNDCGVQMIPSYANYQNVKTGHFEYLGETSTVVFVLDCDNSEVVNGTQGFTIANMPVGTYQVTKTLTLNQASLAFYEEQYMNPEINTCFKTLEEFEEEFLEEVDVTDCLNDPTDCDACVAALGLEVDFIENGGTPAQYAYLVEQCKLPCKPLSIGEAIKNLMLTDMRPNGQYGEYLINGQVHPENFQLSVYNTNNQLPRSQIAVPLSVPDWQKPVLEKSTGTTYKYYEEDLVTESKIQLFNVVLNTSNVITSSYPAIVNGSNYSIDPVTGVYLTVAENLSNVADFISNFKPSWANSLLYYHPEYGYLKTYREFQVEMTVPTLIDNIEGEYDFSSDSFDSKMENADTWQEAIQAKLIRDDYTSYTGMARLYDYTTVPTTVPGYHAYDPFTVSANATSMGWNPYSANFVAKLSSYQTISSTNKNIAEIAAMIGRCGANVGSLGTNCFAFGDDDGGGAAGGTGPEDTLARDKDWQNFKSLYRSLKQQYQAQLADYRAINVGAYKGYNACIGNGSFNPFVNDFCNFPFLGTPYLDDEQPCFFGLRALYESKVKRFTRPENSNITGNSLSLTDPYDAYNETASVAYTLTGNCPASIAISQLMNSLADSDHLSSTTFGLGNTPEFVGYMMSQGLMTNPPTSLAAWSWQASGSGSTITANIVNSSTTVETITLTQGGTPVAWNAIDQIINFHATTTGGLGFQFTAKIISGTDTIPLSGSTTIDILNCTFDAPCTVTEIGSDVLDLMNAMTTSNIVSTTPITVYGTGSTAPINLFVSDLMLNTMNPATSPSTVTWKYDAGTTAFEVAASGSKTIRLDIVSMVPTTFTSFSSIQSFPSYEVTDENTIVVHGYNSSNASIVTLTLDATLVGTSSTTNLVIGDCTQPALGCDDQAVQNVDELTALLNDVLGNNNSPFDLFASAYMTDNLTSQFEDNITSATSTTTLVQVFDDGYDIGTYVISQEVEVSGGVTTTTTVYRIVTATTIEIVTEVTVCDDRGVCVTTKTSSGTSARTFGKTFQTSFTIGDCNLTLLQQEDLVHGYGINDVTGVLELIPTGEPDAIGNYHEFDLVVSMPIGTDTLKGAICLPLRLCDTLDVITTTVPDLPDPTYTNPCVQTAINIALSNAEIAYNQYVDSLLTEFRANYIHHCMSGLESFSRVYNEREYHHTLYYYDQAGNLIKTIPPEGVELLNITSSTAPLSLSIAADRACTSCPTNVVNTSHRMATTYLYNSLNQLIAQHMPDQDDMSSWSQTLANGLDINLTTTAIHMVSESNGYLTGYVSTANSTTGSRGYVYKTTDGGSNWTRITNLFLTDLVRVKMMSATVGFAVGKSGVALRTLDGGDTWDLLNTHTTGAIGDFVDLAFKDANNGAFLMADGKLVRYVNSGSVTLTLISPSITGLTSGESISEIGGTGTTTYLVSERITTGSDVYSQLYNINVSTSAATLENTIGYEWASVYYYSATEGYAAGVDGDIALINETTGRTIMKSANVVGKIVESAFWDKDNGIAMITSPGTSNNYLYKTTDGGVNWVAVNSGVICSSMLVLEQGGSYLKMAVSFANNNLYHYNFTTSGNNITWSSNISVAFSKMDYYVSGTNIYIAGISGYVVYKSTPFTISATTAPTVSSYYTLSSTGGAITHLQAKYVLTKTPAADALHIVCTRSAGTVIDLVYASGTGTISVVTLSAGSTSYKDVVIPRSGSYVLAYEQSVQKVYRLALTTSAPSSGSLAALTNATTLPTTNSFERIATKEVSGGQAITLVGTDGMIWTSATVVTASSSTSLSWTDNSKLCLLPVRSIAPIAYTFNSKSHDAVAVGDYGTGLKRITTGSWQVAPFGVTSSATESFNFSSNSPIIVTSVPYTFVVGNKKVISRINLSTFAVTNVAAGSGITIPNNFKDIAMNKAFGSAPAPYGYAVADNGYVYGINTSLQLSAISSVGAGTSLNGISTIATTTDAVVVGNQGKIAKVANMAVTFINSVFGPRLNGVHFANANLGTIVGDQFFVRSTSDGTANWSKVLPATISGSTLTQNVNDVWTKATVAPATVGAHYALIGGSAYLAGVYGNIATPASSVPGTVNDIQFASSSATNGYFTSANALRTVALTANATFGYTNTHSQLATASTTINAMHVFSNDALMIVGNNMVSYKAPGGVTFTSMNSGLPSVMYNDVVFTDATHGYVVGNNGTFYQTDAVSIGTTAGSPITGITWSQRNVTDQFISSHPSVNITCLAMPSATHGVWGGNYNTTPSGSYTAAVRVLNISNSLYSARLYYDRLGRIIASQNTRQNSESKYSYKLYDALGRVTEAGEKSENTSASGSTHFVDIFGTDVGGQFIATVIDDAKLLDWITDEAVTTRKEVTRNYYDNTNTSINGNGLGTTHPSFFNTATQRKRIVHATYEDVYDANDATYDHATHYNYDIHGSVKELIQDNKKLGALTDLSGQRFKKFEYVFDLISGNLHRMDYQTGKADQWHHAYSHDADNHILDVYTTNSTPLYNSTYSLTDLLLEPEDSPYWIREASYDYYDQGPLARTLLGEEEVQGLDYVYTLQGWIKGINSNTLDVNRDPGLDGKVGSPNHAVGIDVASYSLHYFTGDYTPIVSANAGFVATQGGTSNLGSSSNSVDLYNGNLARMVTTITNAAIPSSRTILPLGSAYKYDQLNRLTNAVSFTNLNSGSNSWSSAGTGIYGNTFTYDANGNIVTQTRYDQNNALIDNLTYSYEKDASNKTKRNRLYHVDDAQTNVSAYNDDIDDMGTYVSGSNINNSNNYAFDAEGRLIKDVKEGIASITWRADGKIRSIIRTIGSTKQNSSFDYDVLGHRVAKHIYSSSNVLERSTYYVLDAQGNTISTYERVIDASVPTVTYKQIEKHMFGSKRLGVMKEDLGLLGTQNDAYSQVVWSHIIGRRTYEISNHLGNVLSVISDKPLPHQNGTATDYFFADVKQATDYSAFGVQLYGRNFAPTATTKSVTTTQTVASFDFENPVIAGTTIDGWFKNTTSTTSVESIGGSQKIKVQSTNNTHGINQYFAAASGVVHTLNLDVDLQGASSVVVVVYSATSITGPSGAVITSATFSSSGPASLSFTSSTGFVMVQIRQTGPFYIDNISITKQVTATVVDHTNDYRYGYQGSEESDETWQDGNGYTTEFRQLDSRLGRWLTMDPKHNQSPWESPYASMVNIPTIATDKNGDFIPLVIYGVAISAEYVAAFFVASATTYVVVSKHDDLKELLTWNANSNYPEPWTTYTGTADVPSWLLKPYSKQDRTTPPNHDNKWIKWILFSATSLRLAEQISKQYKNEPKSREVSMNARISKIKDIGSNKQEVTIVYDVTVKIQSGDNLTTLAKKYGTTVDQLVKWNNIADPDKITAGDKIKIAEKSGKETVKTPKVINVKLDSQPSDQLTKENVYKMSRGL